MNANEAQTPRLLRAMSRLLWLLLGFVLSVVPFLKPIAFAVAFYGVLGLQGVPLGAAVARSFSSPETLVVPLLSVVFAVYWFCVCVLSYQFLRGQRLSTVAATVVAVVAMVFIVVARPWNNTGEPFVPGPEDLLHVVFLLGFALYAARFSNSPRNSRSET